jgi:hypothetical protein
MFQFQALSLLPGAEEKEKEKGKKNRRTYLITTPTYYLPFFEIF